MMSHVTHLPSFRGMSVKPSGCLPLFLSRPVTWQLFDCRDVGLWHSAPYKIIKAMASHWPAAASFTSQSMKSFGVDRRPHGHWWGSQMLAPSRRPTAICTVRSSSRSPQPESNKSCSQSPLWADVTANSGAWSSVLLRLSISLSFWGRHQFDCLWAVRPVGHGLLWVEDQTFMTRSLLLQQLTDGL